GGVRALTGDSASGTRPAPFAQDKEGEGIVRSVIGAVTGMVLGAMMTTAAAATEPAPVKIALPSPIVNFAAEYLAEDLFYKDLGLDVQSMEIAGVGAMNAVISGSVDFSFSSGGSLARAAARGQRLLAIATLGSESGEFAVIRKDIADAAHFDP